MSSFHVQKRVMNSVKVNHTFPCLKIHNTMTNSINNPERQLEYGPFLVSPLET